MSSEINSSERPLALITGASSGIGFELAKEFARNGFDVVITAEDAELKVAASELRNLGANVESFQVDLIPWEGVKELYSKVRGLGRPIDCAAINAGRGIAGDFTRETPLEEELKIMQLNVLSTVHLAKYVLKDMVAQGHGRVLITSSVVSVMPSPLQAVYSATKAFTHSFAESVRNELQDTDVSITSLMPSATDTEFFDDPSFADKKIKSMKKDDPAQVARQGFEALMDGKDHVIGGPFKNKLQVAINKFLTESAKTIAPRSYGEKNH